MHVCDILCEVSKGTSEIHHKISYPYIEMDDSYSELNIKELSDLRARKRFWNFISWVASMCTGLAQTY